MIRMNASNMRHMPLGTIKAHFAFRMPKLIQSAKPTAVNAYIDFDKPLMSRVDMTFYARGAKLAVKAIAANLPIICTQFI
jgi:hypothetical protein